MAIPFVPYTFTDAVANDVTAARLNAIAQAARDAQLMPAVRVSSNANQAITTGFLNTALAFQTELIDQAAGTADTMHDNVTNNSRLTCRYAGVYLIHAYVQWAPSATGLRYLNILHNVTGAIEGDFQSGHASDNINNCTTIYPLAVNEFVTAVVNQTSGGNLNALSGAHFSMVRVA